MARPVTPEPNTSDLLRELLARLPPAPATGPDDDVERSLQAMAARRRESERLTARCCVPLSGPR